MEIGGYTAAGQFRSKKCYKMLVKVRGLEYETCIYPGRPYYTFAAMHYKCIARDASPPSRFYIVATLDHFGPVLGIELWSVRYWDEGLS